MYVATFQMDRWATQTSETVLIRGHERNGATSVISKTTSAAPSLPAYENVDRSSIIICTHGMLWLT